MLQPMRERMVDLFNGNKTAFTREIGFAIQIVSSNDKLMECSHESICKAVYNVALSGLTLNPLEKLAYITPRWNSYKRVNEALLMPSYIGLCKLATTGTRIVKIESRLVMEGDQFEVDYEPDFRIIHKPKFQTKTITHCYAIATMQDGNRQCEVMSISELHDIRALSDSWKAFEANKVKSSIWGDHEGEMCRKTVVKRLVKHLPKDTENRQLNEAINLDNVDYMASASQLGLIESLIGTSSLSEDSRMHYENLIPTLTQEGASTVINYLKNNQLDAITQRGQVSNKAVETRLDMVVEGESQ